MENNVLKSGQQSKFLKEKSNEAKVKNDVDVTETINIELEHSVAKLLAENEQLHKEKEHLKQTYKDLFDSIKRTRVQTKDQNDSLMAQLNNKSNENVAILAQIQKKGFAIAALKNKTQSLVAEKTDISENRASRNFDLMIIKWCLLKITLQAPFLNAFVLQSIMTSDHKPFRPRNSDHTNDQSSSKLVVRLGISAIIQPEPEGSSKDNPSKLEYSSSLGPLEEQVKHIKWALYDWILDGIVNTEFTNVAQVANVARNIEILCERSSQNNKRNRDGDRIRPIALGSNQRGYDQKRYDGRGYDRQGNNQRVYD
ncbi:hypothetical protein Tco_1467148 [Tanacetum coccineum]